MRWLRCSGWIHQRRSARSKSCMKIFTKMKQLPLVFWRVVAVAAAAAAIAPGSGCAGFGQRPSAGSFASARAVIESNCVHCHGANRLAQMPAFTDSAALAGLIGPDKWIVPGQPERSRFLHIVTYADAHPTAMPPTGHALSSADVGKLRAWIAAGAPVPKDPPVILKPRGKAPRSR